MTEERVPRGLAKIPGALRLKGQSSGKSAESSGKVMGSFRRELSTAATTSTRALGTLGDCSRYVVALCESCQSSSPGVESSGESTERSHLNEGEIPHVR